MLTLPPIADPDRYVGLFVYDFGSHVSVGYTAGEIAILRDSADHHAGQAFFIYRVTETGGFELRGMQDERLLAFEAMCFLRADAAVARADYDRLVELATADPVPCFAELHLANVYPFKPPHTVSLLYPAAASSLIGRWLVSSGFAGGDRVEAGLDVYAGYSAADKIRLASCELTSRIDYRDRSAEEVLATTGLAVQR